MIIHIKALACVGWHTAFLFELQHTQINKYFHFHKIFITHTLDTCAFALMTVGRCLSCKALPDSAQYSVESEFIHFKCNSSSVASIFSISFDK